jgi:uncharacterized protein
MHSRSSRSVKITYFPKERVREALAQYVPDIVSRRPEIKRIVLFGSVARGDAVPGSDVDLLLVLNSSSRPFLERISEYRPDRFPVGVEIFAYTQEELDNMLGEGNWFLRRALSEGEVLFDKEAA